MIRLDYSSLSSLLEKARRTRLKDGHTNQHWIEFREAASPDVVISLLAEIRWQREMLARATPWVRYAAEQSDSVALGRSFASRALLPSRKPRRQD